MNELALLFLASAVASFIGAALERVFTDWRRRRRERGAFEVWCARSANLLGVYDTLEEAHRVASRDSTLFVAGPF